ncbi:imidazole glycerol phosphate synthase subunit HisH [Methylophilaceae bacterium]|nr:imidazole glycerol phosphate synthase subunit HisH [Methylophilaceae bacterium]
MNEIVVIDYGVGNLLSVKRGLEYCGVKAIITSKPEDIVNATKIILPGVGAFKNAMQSLESLGLVKVIQEVANRKIDLLGICLGMQLLLDESNEFGLTKGLGLIPGRVVAIPLKNNEGIINKIPHIGWSKLINPEENSDWNDGILKTIESGDSFYFIHSYMALTNNNKYTIAHCLYGSEKIPAVIQRNRIIGCQFHPEKSGEVGLKILREFCEL